MKKVELLAPAGSFESLKAALSAGADAVYMGGTRFGARAYADNPDEDGLRQAIDYCHLRGKKLYMTVNTLFKNEELFTELYAFLKPYYEAGLDAVIVQDSGAISYIAENFPGLDIHLSTQCTITMAEGAEEICDEAAGFLKDRMNPAVTRVVPARELSLDELAEMKKNTGLEIEVFIHGALCYCYSGQCLLSSMAGGRSGNRGRCAQPCRRRYTASVGNEPCIPLKQTASGYFLSPKDMCVLPYIHKLIEAGMDSFKIEGRMKSPEYVAGVVSVYREFIDRYYELGSEQYGKWLSESKAYLNEKTDMLRELYNRGGFNSGYLYEHNGQDMMSLARPNHSGVRVGRVIKCEGRKASIRLEREVKRGDVLEIRTNKNENGMFIDEKALYEFTVGDDYYSGVIFSVLTMKDRTAVPGLEVYRTRNTRLLAEIDDKYIKNEKKAPVSISYKAAPRVRQELTMSSETGISVSVFGNEPDAAKNAPTDEKSVRKQLEKLGETCFAADGRTEINVEGNLFIPVGELNRIRREASDALAKKITDGFRREKVPEANEKVFNSVRRTEKDLTAAPSPVVLVSNTEQLRIVTRFSFITDVYFDVSALDPERDIRVLDDAWELVSGAGQRLWFVLPAIIRRDSYEGIRSIAEKFSAKAGFVVRNHEGAGIINKCRGNGSLPLMRCDYNFYAMNDLSKEMSGAGFTLSQELNEGELKEVAAGDSEMIIYGLIPVMYSAQCVYRNVNGVCRKADSDYICLTDEKGFTFPTRQLCGSCCNIIYNSSILNLLHRYESVAATGCRRVRVNFTFEKPSEVRLVLKCLEDVMNGREYSLPEEIMGMKFTNGHFCRGVE